jgi:hypothetical protein
MISHHHHTDRSAELYSHHISDVTPCNHDNAEHNHDCHAHTVCSDYNFSRSVSISDFSNTDYHLISFTHIHHEQLTAIENINISFPKKEFRVYIKPIYSLETNILRGPPSRA